MAGFTEKLHKQEDLCDVTQQNGLLLRDCLCVCVCCELFRCWQKSLNRATHMTQKYLPPLPPWRFLSLKREHCLHVAYLHPNKLLRASWHTETHTQTCTHVTRHSGQRAGDFQTSLSWFTTGLKRQSSYREPPEPERSSGPRWDQRSHQQLTIRS